MPRSKSSSLREAITTFIQINYPDYLDKILLADGFDNCLIGFTSNQGGNPVAVYDKWKMVKQLAKDLNTDDGEALEYFDYNVENAYVGDFTPKYVDRFER